MLRIVNSFVALGVGAIRAMCRRRAVLVLENLALGKQLAAV